MMKRPGGEEERGRIGITRNERQRRGTRGGRNLLPGLRRRSAKADGEGERVPDPDELPVAGYDLFSSIWPIVWIGAQAGKQFFLEGALLLKIVLDGRGVFSGGRWPHRSGGLVECRGVRPGVWHSVPVGECVVRLVTRTAHAVAWASQGSCREDLSAG